MGIVYDFDLPQLPADHPEAQDVINGGYGELRLTVDGVEQPARRAAVGDLVMAEVEVPKGVVLGGLFTFVDNDGNDSEDPVELTPFTTNETTPPPNPIGNLGARFVRETPDPVV